MKRIFVILVYPFGVQSSLQRLSSLMTKNVIYELTHQDSIEIYKNQINVFCDKKITLNLSVIFEMFSSLVSFHYLEEDFTDLDQMNQHLNSHVQRAVVSSDVEYVLVISGALPLFTGRIFSEYISWESDINIGLTQEQNSALILFRRKFTPFFFRLSDPFIKTGQRSLTVFQQYKRTVTILEDPGFLEWDEDDKKIIALIKEKLKNEQNVHQTEIYRLLSP